MAAQRSNAHALQHSALIVPAREMKRSRLSSSAVHLVECDRAVVSLRQSCSSHAVLIDTHQYYTNLGSMWCSSSSSEVQVGEIIGCCRRDNGCKQSDGADTMTQHLLGGQVLRQILEDRKQDDSARDSNSEDSFLADVMYSLAQGQAGVNNDAHANVFSPAPLFDEPSTSKGTSNAAAFGCVITRAFVEAANDNNDDSTDSEADRAPMTFAQLFDEMRSRAHAAQSGIRNKRGASPLDGCVKNKSLSAATSVSGKTQDTECSHSDDVMSKRAKYKCNDCYCSFSSASNLQRHERGHLGEKTYA
jgi:hypothetical protein